MQGVRSLCLGAVAAALLGGVLLWFAVHFACRAFRVQRRRNARQRRRGDEARPPASEGVAEASQGMREQAGTDARRELLARLAAADAAAQALIAPGRRPKGVLRRRRSVTFAPELASEVEIAPSEGWGEEGGDRRDQAEDPLPARAEETGAELGATLCDVTGRTGVDVSAALSRDEDGDECFVLLRGGGDVILDLKVRLLEFVRDDDALVVWFTADRRQTSREHPIWTLWPHDPKAYARLLAGLEAVPDCCCVAVDACSIQSASRCRRMAARANGCVH